MEYVENLMHSSFQPLTLQDQVEDAPALGR